MKYHGLFVVPIEVVTELQMFAGHDTAVPQFAFAPFREIHTRDHVTR